jgi:alanine racemase
MEPLVASISRFALQSNLVAIRARSGRSAVCAMVKADAYGHGAGLVAPLLADAGAEMLGVARIEEAATLRATGIDLPMLLCEPIAAPGQDAYLCDRLEAICRTPGIRPTVADSRAVQALAAMAERLAVRLPVHVKIDTGMGRSGLLPCDAGPVFAAVARAGSLELEGIYTHLATADEPDEQFARGQLDCFRTTLEQLRAAGRLPRYVHAGNSAGIARFAAEWMTLVRPGLALYGYQGGEGMLGISPVLRLTARLMLVKDLPAGHAVGYGCTWRAACPSRIGVVPIGYGDGYNRRFGNAAVMQVAGRDVPVVGRISMDLTTIDLTGLPDGGRAVQPGAEVTVISERRQAANSVEGLARLAGTIPYEVTCQLGGRIRRQLVDNWK